MLLALGVIWGAAFMATKIATGDFGPFSLAGLRLGIAAVVLSLVLVSRGERLPGLASRDERWFWAAALAVAILSNSLPFGLLAWAQRHIDSGLAGVFMATVPLFVLPLGHFFVPGETMTMRKLAGFGLGFVGILVLIGPDALSGLGGGGGLGLLAQAACLGTAMGYASGSIVAKRAPPLGLLRFGTAALILAATISLPLAFLMEEPLSSIPSTEGALSILYLGLVPTALATLLLLSVIGSAGPGFLSLVNYQVPVWAVLFGALLLGESPSPRLGIALALILTGLALAQGVLGLRRGAHARG